jgi:hypothetical protein
MKLTQAIEILESWQAGGFATRIDDMNPALKLGIEALKEVKKARSGDPALDGELLPGETV